MRRRLPSPAANRWLNWRGGYEEYAMNITTKSEADRRALSFAMNLSLVIGLLMFVMKMGAYLLTGSAAILSDAAESVVHVAAVIFAAYSLRLSYRPADEDHLYGHAKISFFSAGFEGAMIILAAIYIIYESIHKWLGGLQLENLGAGTVLTAAAAAINGGLGGYLVWLGRRKHSLILEANGKHVLTDCWTSIAVLVGLTLVMTTKWLPFDPICGIIMAGNILWSGTGLMRSAFVGLMDKADPAAQAKLTELLDRETQQRGLSYHQLRHRNLGDAHWVEVHLLFPEGVSLTKAHQTATEIEQVIEASLEPRAYVTTHLECASDHENLHPHEGAGKAKP
jgi:cation diffusion facilitator family transporter